MAKDLKDAALEAFKRSAMGGDTSSDTPEAEVQPTDSGDKTGPSAKTTAGSGKKTARAMTATIRRGPPPKPGARKKTSGRSAPQATLERAGPAAQTRRPGIVAGKTTTKKETGPASRGLLWCVLVMNFLLLILAIVLLVKVADQGKRIETQGKTIAALSTAIETVAKSADETRQTAQAKFGVFLDEKKKLHGVFVNFKKPSRYRSIELSSETK